MTSPLSDPIRTGPSMGLTIWGLNEFKELDDKSDSILFSPEDMYYRDCTPETANAWLIEMFNLLNRYWAGVRTRGDGYVLLMSFRDFLASRAVIELAVIPLPGQPCFIAAFASRIHAEFPSDSGYVMGGHGQRNLMTGKGHILKAFYPREAGMGIKASSLDRASV
jgi:hypothetical protein